MADKNFGVKRIELIGSSGTPNLTSPGNLNLNAVNVAISTDVTIGGKVQSDVIVGSGYSVGIGSTLPQQALDVDGAVTATGLDVNGTVNVTGVSTFGNNVRIEGSTESETTLTLRNTSLEGNVSAINFEADNSGVSTSRILFDWFGSEYGSSHGMNYVSGRGASWQNHWFRNGDGDVQLSIRNDGKVAIGSHTPAAELDVDGDARVGAGLTVVGVATAASFVRDGGTSSQFLMADGSVKSRTREVVSGSTTSITNNGIGNTDITGFKAYTLMKVGLSTAGWLRLYTDSASRTADASRSIGEDPTPGSGVIAEVVTTGLSTSQNISPFVIGGNMDDPATTTMYVAITNTSGVTTSITANLTILQLED
jgi:hypothetical protein